MRYTSRFITGSAMLGLCVALAGCGCPAPPPRPMPPQPQVIWSEETHTESVSVKTTTTAQMVTSGEEKPKEPKEPKPDRNKAGKGNPAPQPAIQSPTTQPTVATKIEPKKTPPRPAAPIDEHVVSSVPYLNESEADDDAIEQAREIIAKKLASQDPPIYYKPSANEVRAEYLHKESRQVRSPNEKEKELLAQLNMTGEPKYVEYQVEVSAEQIRKLRSQDHVSSVMRVVGVLFALALFGFLFLRADEWTKGYLTSWLALVAFLLAGGAAAALIFI